jgi:hypothetical protein
MPRNHFVVAFWEGCNKFKAILTGKDIRKKFENKE